MHRRLLLAIIFGTIFFFPWLAFSAAPVVYFSDLTDGPVSGWNGSTSKGAAVSVWGNNFGSSRGTSYVTVGGVNLTKNSDYAEWGATTNPTTARGLQRITFWLNSNMTLGNTTISVTTPEGTSSTISFYTRNTGHIYFVDPSGKDGHTGLNDTTQAWQTWHKVKSSATAGDVVYFRSGTWTAYEYSGSRNTMLFFNGETYSGYEYNNGTANNSISFASYPGELAHIGDGTTTHFMWRYSGELRYWTFSKFDFNMYDNILTSVNGPVDDHIRWIGLKYTTTAANMGMGYAFNGYTDMLDYKIYGCYAYDCGGGDYGSAMYFGGGQSQVLDIGWNEFTGSYRQIQFYGHRDIDYIDTIYFHDNYVHHNLRVSVMMGGGDPATGAEYSFVKNGYIYNNIIANNDGEMRIADGSKGTHGNFHVYSNTFYNNALGSAFSREFWVAETDSLEFKDNIIYAGAGSNGGYFTYFEGSDANIIGNHNCWFGQGDGPTWDTSNFNNTNPQFVIDPPVNYYDFRLKDSSPIVVAGEKIGVQFDGVLGGEGDSSISSPQDFRLITN